MEELNYIVTDDDGKRLGRVMAPEDKANLRKAFVQLLEIYQLVYDIHGWYPMSDDFPACRVDDEFPMAAPSHDDDTICDHCSLLIPSDDRWRQVAMWLEEIFESDRYGNRYYHIGQDGLEMPFLLRAIEKLVEEAE